MRTTLTADGRGTDDAADRQSRSRFRGAWLVAAVFVVAAAMRTPVSSVGPVLTDIRQSLGLSAVAVSVLTALPVVCFGALAPLGPWMTRKLGLTRAIAAFCAAIVAGLLIRVGAHTGLLFFGTFVAAGGIAAANVLLPALIKRDYPSRTGAMMGVYTLGVIASGALGAGLTVPFADAVGGGWRWGLGIWAAPAAAALVVWMPWLKVDSGTALQPPAPFKRLLRDRIAWSVTLFFGVQSVGFYAILTWLPTLFEDHGFSDVRAGALLSVSSLVQAPIALVTPSIAARLRTQALPMCVSVGFIAAGLSGLLIAPTFLPLLWVIVLGIGQGASFPLALILMVLRTRTAEVTQQLSSMSQGIGYLIAALGPLVVGAVHDAAGTWVLPLAILLALCVPQLLFGLDAARPRFVGQHDGTDGRDG